MKKGLFLLAFLAFTQNVKADYAPIDIQIAEGEEYQIEQIVASQVINQTSWDGTYILTGGLSRVYTDYLPRDGFILDSGFDTGNHYAFLQRAEYNESYGGWVLTEDTVKQFTSPYEAYQYYLQHTGNYNDYSAGVYFYPIEIYQDDVGEYLDLSSVIGYLYTRGGDNFQSKSSMSELAKKSNTAQLLQKGSLLKYAQVPINGVTITITNSVGQTTTQFDTNVVLKLDQILQKVTRIQNDTSTMVNELIFLLNAFGYDGTPGSTTGSLAEFLGQWRTADGVWQGEISDVITNLSNQADYTDWWRLLASFKGATNVDTIVELTTQFSRGPSVVQDGFLGLSSLNALLGFDYSRAFMSFLLSRNRNILSGDTSWMPLLASALDRDYYYNMGVDWQDFHRQTNIVNAVSLGRDWLTLATNDISSLPYWLNQQDFSSSPPIGVTNWQFQTRWSVLTNQYAQIGLTGSGQQANSAETWNYFKRLEMLLAALVYKPDDEGEKLSNDMNSQSSDAETKKEDVKNSLDGLLNSFGGQKTLLQGQTSSFLSALGRVNEMFDQTWTPGQWRYWKDDAEHGGSSSSGGASGSSVELWIDFSDSKYQFIFDFIRSLCGFVWSFFSLLIIYKFAIFAYKLGMKFARVAYSILRHMFGQ